MAISPRKIISLVFLLSTFSFVISCGANSAKPTSTAIAATIPASMTPTLKPLAETTITPTIYPKLIFADSPNSKYHVELKLDATPINLIITNTESKHNTQVLITNRYYNRIMDGTTGGFQWANDSNVLLFELFREPYPDKFEDDFSSFVAVDLKDAKVLNINYSRILRGLRVESNDIAYLEHAGLNDIYDYYIIGTNCYKSYLEGECVISDISPTGTWGFNQWSDADTLLTNYLGETWKYDYLIKSAYDANISFVQRWASDETYVYFSPSKWYAMPYALGLFRMDLSNGKVTPIFNEELNREKQFYYLSLSPSSKRIFYIDKYNKTVIRNFEDNSERDISQIVVGSNQIAGNFLWSPDETKLVFMIEDLDKEYNYSSADYLILNMETGETKTFLKDQKEYLFVTNINNDSITLSNQERYSLFDGSKIK